MIDIRFLVTLGSAAARMIGHGAVAPRERTAG